MSDSAITQENALKQKERERAGSRLFSGKQGRALRESLLAYTFLLPSLIIIGLFGLFPLLFSAFQSTRRGLNQVVGRYDGLGNYVRSLDNLAYVLGFWLAIFFIFLALNRVYAVRKTAKQYNEKFALWLGPGFVSGTGLSLLLVFLFVFMPNLLGIGEAMRGYSADERNGELFRALLSEAFNVTIVQQAFWSGLILFIVGIIIATVIRRMQGSGLRDWGYYGQLTTGFLFLFIAVALSALTWLEIQLAYVEALEDGIALDIWAQIVTISAGFVLLGIAWVVWRNAHKAESGRATAVYLIAGCFLIIGGWVLIGELPRVIASGDEDWWQGLTTTIYYAAGSLPFQLFFALLFATMLFQDIKGKTAFRVIYFLPYITPAIGSAAVFRVIFSGREAGPINQLLRTVGLEPMGWLNEPSGIFELMAESLNLTIPDWAGGPSLALTVVIIYSVWRYMGYNIVFFLAGLGNISSELYEAASIDGANRWEQFRNITLPLLSPTTYFLTIFGVIGTFKAFNTIFVLRTNAALGTMDTASLVIFDAFRRDTRYGYAAALAIVLLIIILTATYIFNKFAEDRVFYG